jgi:hypothetical protein
MTPEEILAESIAQGAETVHVEVHNLNADRRWPLVHARGERPAYVARYKLMRYEIDEAPGLEGSGRMAHEAAFLIGAGGTRQEARDRLPGRWPDDADDERL